VRHILNCILFLTFIIILTGCTKEKTAIEETKSAVKGDINEVVSASGIVLTKQDQVAVTPKIMGTVEKIYFEENCVVKKDQILIELDKTDLLKQLQQAQASLAVAQVRVKQADTTVELQPAEVKGKIAQAEGAYRAAQKQLEQLKIQIASQEDQLKAKITDGELLLKTAQNNMAQATGQVSVIEGEASAGLSQAQMAVDTAKSNYERQKNLYSQGFISKQDYELSESQYQKTLNDYKIAEEKVESARLQSRQATNGAETQVKQAEEALRLAKTSLAQQKEASKKQIDIAQTQAEQAYAALESARALYGQITLREQEAEAARHNVTQLQIGIEQIKDQINKTTIKAPVSGTIIQKQVVPGQAVSPTFPVAIIANLDRLIIQAMVDEGDIGKVKERQKVIVTTDNFPEEKFSGEVIMVASAAFEGTKSIENVANYKVTIALDNTKGLLKMGMNTYNDIVVAQRKNVITVPNIAIHQSNGKSVVYIPDRNGHIERIVETGLSDNENTEIISGLSEGEKIIPGSIVKSEK